MNLCFVQNVEPLTKPQNLIAGDAASGCRTWSAGRDPAYFENVRASKS
jgi:hypothetical protein